MIRWAFMTISCVSITPIILPINKLVIKTLKFDIDMLIRMLFQSKNGI